MNQRKLVFVVFFCFLVFAAGCAPKASLHPVSMDKRIAELRRSALDMDDSSERTKIFLMQMELEARWKDDPLGTLLFLDNEVRESSDRETLFALTELCYLQAKRTKVDNPERMKLYVSCAVYAFRYLFDPSVKPELLFYHPYGRVAAMFYNRSVAEIVVYAKQNNIRYAKGLRFPLLSGELEIQGQFNELIIPPKESGDFFPSYNYEVKGLEPQMLYMGIGVPLVVVRLPSQSAELSAEERFVPTVEQAFAATALLRLLPDADNKGSMAPNTQGVYIADFELYDPMKSEYVTIAGHKIPLETDMTTPLAYTIEKAPDQSGFEGMINPDAWKDQQGLYTLQPYIRGRIPIVFVHGLMSSPPTWMPMLNLLMGDPVLRTHYQFWFFKYPTGNPILYSASILRDSLQQAIEVFDPQGTDAALRQIVIVGHSMGGLLTKMMVMESGDEHWRMYVDQPLDTLNLQESDKELLRKLVYFEPLPFVSRVVFMATPHRGAEMALGVIGRIGIWLITLPVTILESTGKVFAAIAQAARKDGDSVDMEDMSTSFTGIDGLSPKNKTLLYFADKPITTVPFHSIIGNKREAGVPGGTDGVVAYESAHLDGAQSEIILLSDHSVQQRPLAVREVRRILLEHLRELGRI